MYFHGWVLDFDTSSFTMQRYRESIMLLEDPHFRPKNPTRWSIVGAALREHPEWMSIALENLDRWEKWGRTHPAPLRQWRKIIQEAQSSPELMDAFLVWLSLDNADEEPLKSCSPFVGPPFLVL